MRVFNGQKWTNRGGEDIVDFAAAALTKDGNWNDMDLSSIIPQGVSLVLLSLKLSHTTAAQKILFRTKGVINDTAIIGQSAGGAMALEYSHIEVQPDSDGIVQYQASSAETWVALDVRVMGWLK